MTTTVVKAVVPRNRITEAFQALGIHEPNITAVHFTPHEITVEAYDHDDDGKRTFYRKTLTTYAVGFPDDHAND